ncbi:MAG: mechanosensitive ion channel [Aetokthonos hydrillicola CCALA 1050]|jgi:MscS family membrane protein|nr:mechanosensitive ion channel [Aetokthonos hydrillicola CCALA 1050]MBW4585467.1 mechanosensitive ion channel [Aetokthonos hydrillicola CCALA 1050]
MIDNLLNQLHKMNTGGLLLTSLLISVVLTGVLYTFLQYILRPVFRQFEKDTAIVTLNVSIYPALIIFQILSLKIISEKLASIKIFPLIDHILISSVTIVASYWAVQLFTQVFIYSLKEYTKQTEVMWDDVLLPILSAVVPILIFVTGGVLVISSFGVDLTGVWVALGGATFVLGFALQDILANFFSGIVLLIDTPFRFGDILLLEDGSIGMLRRIGIRVTQLYVFSDHCDVYVPNSVLQGQKITNLSRPTSLYYHSLSLEIPSECDLNQSKELIEEIVLAHPDTLGDMDLKLDVIDEYYNSEDVGVHVLKQQKYGKLRLLAEQAVDSKLDEIEQALEALVVTIQCTEKGGMTEEEIDNVQQEYQGVLELMGFQLIEETHNNRTGFNFEENSEEGLVELIREWYRSWIKDPNLLDEDEAFISEEWERKISLLKRRAQRLSQKISNPKTDETRLDDYVVDLIEWLKEKLKVPRKKWQEPKVKMIGMNHDESSYYVELEVAFFVDEIKLEDGKRGDRVRSQIYQEIFRHFKNTYLDWDGVKEIESAEDISLSASHSSKN